MSLDWLMIPVVLADSADGGLWPAAVAISGIVMVSSYAIVESIIRHRERMAKSVWVSIPMVPPRQIGRVANSHPVD
jgi:hypothetical protein